MIDLAMTFRTLSLCCLFALTAAAQTTVFESQEIFTPETWHNHSSSIVELPGGDLFVVWFHGSGERTADDVVVLGSRWRRDRRVWTAPMKLADYPGFPDTNPVVYLDSKKRLWLFWAQVIANEWHTAITHYKRASEYSDPTAPPKWDAAGDIVLIPRNIAAKTKEAFPDREKLNQLASDKYFSRMGWFTRTHPFELPSGRMIVPMYSDGYSYGIMAITDDGGETWTSSEPIVGAGSIQPTVVQKRDGTLVAYLRDNGPPPKRALMATSTDSGVSWTPAHDTEIPNPGSSLEAIRLKTGEWLMIGNDTEKGRNRLRASLSDDEGKTWKWHRYIENRDSGQFHYPSVIQSPRDGAIHITYSRFLPAGSGQLKTIVHARFDGAWVKAGDGATKAGGGK